MRRGPLYLALLGVVLSLLAIVLSSSALAQTPGGSLGGGGVGSSIDLPGSGSSGTNNATIGTGSGSSGGGSGSGGSGEAATSHWTRHFYGVGGDPGYTINPPFFCPAGQAGYEDVLTDNASGVVLSRAQGCSPLAVPGGPAVTAPPPPPAPPTAAEARSLVPLPAPAFGVSPIGIGRTGLPTWLWDSNGVSPRSATSTIRGYTVTSTARPIRWSWDMADTGPASVSNPPSVIISTRPGTEADPAGRYTYETLGEYGLRLTVTWGGSYTYSGNGVASVTSDLGTTTRTSTRGFAVGEIRPVLKAA